MKENHIFKITINDCEVTPTHNVKNLGVILDQDLTMSPFVNKLSKDLFFQLKKISNIRRFLTEDTTKALVTSLILSKLDYCNSLLAGVSNELLQQLQKIQNFAARLIKLTSKRDHITPILKDLHWLPVKERITYKISLFCFNCINNQAPSYLSDCLNCYVPTRKLRSSNDTTTLVQANRKYKYYGQRSISYCGPLVWNKLPKSIREVETAAVFKRKLKTHLFESYYI